MFSIDPQLLNDSVKIADLELSTVILKNDKSNPWFMLVPRRPNLIELVDLTPEMQGMLMEEISLVSEFLKEYYRPYKINVASLGNVVRQLHIHIIARFQDDRAWPNPIWNTEALSKFEEFEIENLKSNFLEFID